MPGRPGSQPGESRPGSRGGGPPAGVRGGEGRPQLRKMAFGRPEPPTPSNRVHGAASQHGGRTGCSRSPPPSAQLEQPEPAGPGAAPGRHAADAARRRRSRRPPLTSTAHRRRRVSRASVRMVPSTKATRRGRFASVGRCARNAPPSSTSSHSTAGGESSDALEAGPVGGVEGLDADGSRRVRRVSWALHPPQARCASRSLDTLRAYDDTMTDHDTEEVDQVTRTC